MTIPASQLVSVTPSVIAPGGSNLVMNGMMVTANTRAPIGSILTFPTLTAVQTYFGATSAEAGYAAIYFQGYVNSYKKPAALLFAQVPYLAPVGAYLRGGPVSGTVALATLQGFNAGVLNITIDGSQFVTGAVNLGGATSFSGVAALLQTALQAVAPTAAVVTGSIASRTLTISAVTSGVLSVGQVISGTGVTAGTTITALGTGTGGVGTYTVSTSQTTASTAITAIPAPPTVIYDSVSSAFVVASGSVGTGSSISFPQPGNMATAAFITQATGAVLSQGAAIASGAGIAPAMTAIAALNRGWAGFMTLFEPTLTDKVLFAAWCSPLPYWYAMWDTNVIPAGFADTSSAGYIIRQSLYNGIVPIYLDPNVAAGILGAGASVDYNRRRGRETLAYLQFAGVTPMVLDGTTAGNLIANGYNFYGSYANAGNGFIFFQNGSITGNFAWWDSYTNQIWMNNNIQTSLIQLLMAIGNVPYNDTGYTLISTALYSGANPANGNQPQTNAPQGPIAAAVNFGAINAGVTLSANQVAAVNNAAGRQIDGVLNQVGWYLQVLDPGSAARVARQSPIVNFWYMDGQTVQTINVASIDVQ